MRVSEKRFEELVADALDAIPTELAKHMENVAVVVEDWPNPEQTRNLDKNSTLLGLYEGISLTDRSPMWYEMVLPDRITIFRGPLSALSSSEKDLRHRITVTVVHEVGHHFGISDERLGQLGWA